MEDREFEEFCVKHGFDPDKLDALTTCWLRYSMLDDIRNAERTKEPADDGDGGCPDA
ncbi:MAG: hypothetical protein J5569_01460 [Oscillospiraceae bacterium]|nr:hypothetical protein [Oscillospiraceae bacterium]